MTTTAPSGRALLLSSDDEPLGDIEAELTTAGWEIHRCHDAGAPSFPCAGLDDGECPLDSAGGVDVAIDVRQHPWPSPTPREIGVTCALRARVPVVVVAPRGHPFESWATTTTLDALDMAEVCEDAVADSLEEPRAVAAEAVGAVFANHDLEGTPFSIRVERRLQRVRVRIAAAVPSAVGAMAVARAAIAIRSLDTAATSIEIELVEPAG